MMYDVSDGERQGRLAPEEGILSSVDFMGLRDESDIDRRHGGCCFWVDVLFL